MSTRNRQNLRFPKRFLWGAATSAHQVEGGLHNQWTVWELENAKSLAARASYQYSDLDNWSKISREAQNPPNYVSGRAVDHFSRYEEDFDILKQLNLNAFRFGIEWSRVEPEEGRFSTESINHYRAYIQALKKRGIVPVLTLFHFTLPTWFAERGGFEKRSNIKYFVRFAERIFDEFASDLRWVITVNEPEIYASESYRHGQWPPQKISRQAEKVVLLNLAAAHRRIYRRAKKQYPNLKLSAAKNSSYIYAGDDAWLSQASASWLTWSRDDWFLNQIKRQLDFLGVNYYFSDQVYGYRVHNPDDNLNDLGWDMQPANIEYVLERLNDKYKLPIMITENGLADADDQHRKWWIGETIRAMDRAMKKDVKLIGYLHWSLLDNFEWNKGFWPKFGLVSVNRRNMERTIRPSASWYGEVVRRLRKLK